jgi:hypothetical protein
MFAIIGMFARVNSSRLVVADRRYCGTAIPCPVTDACKGIAEWTLWSLMFGYATLGPHKYRP